MNWHLSDNQYVFEHTFSSQKQLVSFLSEIARISDEHDHHADWFVSEAFHLKMILFTHDTNSITEKDHQLIEAFQSLQLF